MSFQIKSLFGVAGKVALVTGATRGIGRMIAQGLAQNGARVYIVGRDLTRTAVAAKELGEFGHVLGLAADLSTIAGAHVLAAEFSQKETTLNILVNNAGVFMQAPFAEYGEAQYDYTMTLNAKIPFFLTQALLGPLRAAASAEDPARVVNMASGAGMFVGGPGMYSYGASKAALIHLTKSLAGTLACENINVNAITPGMVVTEVSRAYVAEVGERITSTIPTGRFTSPEQIAGTVIYLCGRAGANTTGHVLSADGGQNVMSLVR